MFLGQRLVPLLELYGCLPELYVRLSKLFIRRLKQAWKLADEIKGVLWHCDEQPADGMSPVVDVPVLNLSAGLLC